MCQGVAEKLSNSSEHCQVQEVASLLAQALSRIGLGSPTAGNIVYIHRATKGANRGPARVRAEPDDRRSARGGLRLALRRRQPARVPAPRGGLLGGGGLGGGRPGPKDQDDAGVPGRGPGHLRGRGLPRRRRAGTQNGVGRGGGARLLGLARGGKPRGGRKRGGRTPFLRRTLGGAGDPRAGLGGPRPPGGGHHSDPREHPQADRGGLGQGGSPASSGGRRAAARGEPYGGRRGPAARVTVFSELRFGRILRSPTTPKD